MFMFSASGSLSESQGRSRQGPSSSSSKPDYVPSTYIAKQLQLEEEARRSREQNQRMNGLCTTQPTESPSQQYWPGPEQVLVAGYASGPLGYQVPTPSATSQLSPLPNNNHNHYANTAAGFGLGLQGSSQSAQTSVCSRLYQDLHGVANAAASNVLEQSASKTGSSSTGPNGIVRMESRPELNKDDIMKKNTPVRFSSAGTDVGSPRPPQSPSLYNQSPFFNSSSSSGLKEQGKVNVLTRGSSPTLNSSLGPPLGSVSGTTQPAQTYSSPRMQGDMSSPSMRSSSPYSGTGRAQSPFLMSLDGSTKRQNSKLSGPLGKGGALEEDEDKDKERYMPAILLSTTAGLKGSKMEPFVDANGHSGWDSDSHQPGSIEKPSHLPPHLLGEDAPPADTLYDIAQKEKYYSRPASPVLRPNQDTRSEVEIASSDTWTNGATVKSREDKNDSIITFGFPPEAASYMLNQFRTIGVVIRYEAGTYGRIESESFNWLKIQFSQPWAARNALSRHLKGVGKFIVGVLPCLSFSTNNSEPINMAMDVTADGDDSQRLAGHSGLTGAEAKELESAVDALLLMRAQGMSADATHAQAQATQASATKIRQASLYESWVQGGSGAGASGMGSSRQQSTLTASSMGYSATATLNDGMSTTAAFRSSTMTDPTDEDVAYILGHSLTSGGLLARSSRGWAFKSEKPEIARSKSKDHQLEQTQDEKQGDGMYLLSSSFPSEAPAAPIESASVGFRPLFGQNESRGLDSSQQQQQPPQQQLQYQHFFEQRQQQHQQQQQTGSGLGGQHRLSMRRDLGESTLSDTTLFASSGGILLNATLDRSSSTVHTQKKQRLMSGLCASASSPSTVISFNSGVRSNAPLSEFGKGKDRASRLIDDPALVDEWGTPLRANANPGTASIATNTQASASTGAAGAGAAASAPETVLSSVLNLAKKRLFWG
ncbi:Nucleoporin nup35 [Mortierella sp. GBA30]|nr:Nucleoporin nup35 [Mortierella sp. GBA30]